MHSQSNVYVLRVVVSERRDALQSVQSVSGYRIGTAENPERRRRGSSNWTTLPQAAPAAIVDPAELSGDDAEQRESVDDSALQRRCALRAQNGQVTSESSPENRKSQTSRGVVVTHESRERLTQV